MDYRRLSVAFALGLVALAPVVSAQSGSARKYVPGRVLVKFKQGVSDSQASNVFAALQSRSTGQIRDIGVHLVALQPGANEATWARSFASRPEVQFAELDWVVPHADVTPNDPDYALWEWHLKKISAPSAWSTTTGSTSIIIAILDTGVDGTHEDLASKMVAGWNVYGNDSNTSDIYGHGTQVAGTVASASNNGIGIASVAWGCWIMPVRIADSNGWATYSDIASGLTWAADHGARVANISYIVTGSATVTSGAQYFQSKGGVVAASAGNYGTFDSSADNPYILTVTATDENDNLYAWSNTGNNIDVTAPGCVVTTLMGGGYGSACGTSFSAPIAAGVAALILSAKPGLTPAQVTSMIEKSADDLGPVGWDPSYGWGRVNAANAITLAMGGAAPAPTTDTQPPTVSFQSPASGATVSGTIAVQVAASDNVGVVSVIFYVDGVQTGSASSSPYAWSLKTSNYVNGSHTLSATASDAAGNKATAGISVNVGNLGDTQAPVIAITSPSAGSTVSGNVPVYVSASDNVGVVRVELYADGVLTATSTSAPFNVKWNTAKVAKGPHTLQSKAYDAAGNVGVSSQITVYK